MNVLNAQSIILKTMKLLYIIEAGCVGVPQNTANESAVHSLPQQRLYNKFSHTWRSCQIDQLAITRLMQNGALHAALPSRWFSSSKLKPKHVGCKLKVYSSFKERFKLTATGRVKYMPPGHRHKRSSKSMDQNRNLRKSSMLFSTYAKTMKKLGFRMTSY
jgi:large subunit ribosomal protein L35